MGIRIDPKNPYVNEPVLWDNDFPYHMVPIFHGKKRKNVVDLLAILELNGVATTTEMAKFAIESHYSRGQIADLEKNFVRRRSNYFWNHLHGYVKNQNSKKKMGAYKGLLKQGYVKIIDSPKENVHTYFPTLSGHLVALGYVFNEPEMYKFIKNASANSLYFVFLLDIIHKTSMEFFKELFWKPIKNMIKRRRIQFYDDYRLNFDLIASATALRMIQIIQRSWEEWAYPPKTNKQTIQRDQMFLKQIDTLVKNTWFDLHADSKWVGRLVELYYPTDEQRMFYEKHSDSADAQLIYKVMREIHVNYYHSHRVKVPVKYVQKFPLPLKRNRKKKNRNTVKRKFPDLKLTEYHF